MMLLGVVVGCGDPQFTGGQYAISDDDCSCRRDPLRRRM